MRVLQNILPTAEQLTVIRLNRPGFFVVRGAAGSGKTTSALMRLHYLAGAWIARRERLGLDDPVKILVLTYNRTLRGYISELAHRQIENQENLSLTIATFGKWSKRLTLTHEMLDDSQRYAKIKSLGRVLDLESNFITDEVEYAIGRFAPGNISAYLTCERRGRGLAPRFNRQQMYENVILPYMEWKDSTGLRDWNDLAVELIGDRRGRGYDIIIADEVQDFSANQVRAISSQLADTHSVTFILDAAQQIYARGFTWQEAGVTVGPRNVVRLRQNHRNTKQIAMFARPLIEGLDITEDGTMPDFDSCTSEGDKPLVLRGKFSAQIARAIEHIRDKVDLANESVAFLHPLGWFSEVRKALDRAGLDYVSLTRQSEWPSGDENIALSTLHSAKGLEFDHVLLLGLNDQVTRHGSEEGDTQVVTLRKLLAMAVSRAKKAVVIGYKPEESSILVDYFDEDACVTENV